MRNVRTPGGRWTGGRWKRIVDAGVVAEDGWKALAVPVMANGRELIQAVDEWGQHHLLVPADDGRHASNTQSPLSVVVRDFCFGSGGADPLEGRYLDIHCRLPELNAQFDAVVDDVVEAVRDSRRPVGAAIAAVASWRRLFASLAGARALTHQEKLSAFGELSVLQELLAARAFDVRWWTGPSRSPHDFELPGVSIEVKTVGEQSETITVHGFAQLAPKGDKELLLVVRTLIESEDGRTLPELLDEVLATCDDHVALREKAALLGIHEAAEDTTRFAIAETIIGVVGEEFPRLTVEVVGGDLSEAIGSVSYDLRLDAVRPFLKPEPPLTVRINLDE